jgi:hypothetical protein
MLIIFESDVPENKKSTLQIHERDASLINYPGTADWYHATAITLDCTSRDRYKGMKA